MVKATIFSCPGLNENPWLILLGYDWLVWQNGKNPSFLGTLVNKYGLLTKRKVKKWLNIDQVFLGGCFWTEMELRFIQKCVTKELGQYPAILTEHAWSIKDLLYGKSMLLSCGTLSAGSLE